MKITRRPYLDLATAAPLTTPDPTGLRCSKCERYLTTKSFSINRQASRGRSYKCKDCARIYVFGDPIRVDKQRAYGRAYTRNLRQAALNHYGRSCACCGEATWEFLAIDHIEGCGKEQRARQKGFMRWLRKHNYPAGYRTLCHNCNSALGFYGHCPHKQDACLLPVTLV